MGEAENEPIIDIDENLRIIGTAHVSKDSVELVDKQIEEWGPDVVAIELCNSRAQALKDERRLDQEGLRKVIKEGKAPLVLFQSMLAAEQRRLGMDEGVQPGAELLGAMNSAEEKNIEVALVDRDIQITLRRAWRNMGLREKWRILWGLVAPEEDSEEDIPEINELLSNKDLLSELMEELKQIAPSAGEVLVDERDEYLATKIEDQRSKGKVLAVIGAGHLDGVSKRLQNRETTAERIEELEIVPRPNPLWKVVMWGIPLLVFGLMGWFLYTGAEGDLYQMLTIWTLFNAAMAAICCMIARGHPLAILTAAIASPITSLNPALAAGWFAGYVQLVVREPSTKDLKDFLKLDEMKLFWSNRAGRVLLVTALTNLGSMLGAWFATAGIITVF
jgi:pheromone shutdown-related protein TraB